MFNEFEDAFSLTHVAFSVQCVPSKIVYTLCHVNLFKLQIKDSYIAIVSDLAWCWFEAADAWSRKKKNFSA